MFMNCKRMWLARSIYAVIISTNWTVFSPWTSGYSFYFKTVISFSNIAICNCNRSIWNCSNTTNNIKSVLWMLMAWCFSTMASVVTVLSTHTCVFICLWANSLQHFQAWTKWPPFYRTRFKFHWKLFRRDLLTILAMTWQHQAIICASNDQASWRHMVSLVHTELSNNF